MPPGESNFKLASRNTITNDVVFIDGVMRTGKHLVAGIVASFERCEMWQNLILSESAPVYHALGKITEDAAIQMIQTEIDINFYYTLIGRRVNFRYSDASSIWNSRDPGEYLQRIGSPLEHEVINRLAETRPISLVFTHEVMCHPGIVFAAYPNVKFLLSQRNPVDVVDSWIRKKWGDRIGVDPTSTMPALSVDGEPVPWFAEDRSDEYLMMGSVDRIIFSVSWLGERQRHVVENLSEQKSKQILKIYYEFFSVNPDKQINDMAVFLGTELSSISPTVFRKLGIPIKFSAVDYNRKLASIKELATPEFYQLLIEMADNYIDEFENSCGLEFSKTMT